MIDNIEKLSLDELYEMQDGIDCDRFPEKAKEIRNQIILIESLKPKFPRESTRKILGQELSFPWKYSNEIISHIPALEKKTETEVQNTFIAILNLHKAKRVIAENRKIFVPYGFNSGWNKRHPKTSIKSAEIEFTIDGDFIFVKSKIQTISDNKIIAGITVAIFSAFPIIGFVLFDYSLFVFVFISSFLLLVKNSSNWYFKGIINEAIIELGMNRNLSV